VLADLCVLAVEAEGGLQSLAMSAALEMHMAAGMSAMAANL
jgi:hypothetical protein